MTTITREHKVKQKREKLIEAASVLFSEKNFHEVMMEDVARAASVAKGTVYNYFDSKEELYFSIMQSRMEKLIFSLKEKISSEMRSIDRLQSFVIHLYMFMMKYQSFFLIYRRENLKAVNDLCSLICKLENELKTILIQIIQKGKEEKLLREIEETLAVDLVLGSIYSAVHRGVEFHYNEENKICERKNLFEYIKNGLFENNSFLPLKNKTIVITRAETSVEESGNIFKELGAEVISFPTIAIVPTDDWDEFDNVIIHHNEIDFIIFTSVHAVTIFNERLSALNLTIDYDNLLIIAVGKKTASACKSNNIPVNIIPDDFNSLGIIKSIEHIDLHDKTILIPRSAIGREELPIELEKRGANVKSITVYNVTLPAPDTLKKSVEAIESQKPDLFIFTSPSTFNNFLEIVKVDFPDQYFNDYLIAAIGPTTKEAIESKGVPVNIMPSEYTIEGLTESIINFYKHTN